VRPVEGLDGRLRRFVRNANRRRYRHRPTRTVRAGNYVILVWDRNVMPLVAAQ
jgi:hypothetical protein